MANPSEVKSPDTKPESIETTRLRDDVAQNTRSARDSERVSQTMGQATETVESIGETMANKTSETAQRTIEHGRETAQRSIDAIASAQAPLADMRQEGTRKFAENAEKVTAVYRDAAERSADDIKALVGAYSNIGRGLQGYQHAYLDDLRQSMQTMTSKWQALFRAQTPVAFAETQRDIYFESLTGMISGTTKLLELMGKISQDASKPLQQRGPGSAI